MAKIIEISGPAGAGKSTILKGLSKGWNKNADWIYYQKILPYQKINVLNVSNFLHNLPSLIKSGKTNLDNKALYAAGKHFIKQNSAYIDAYWQSLNANYKRDFNGYDGRFDSSAKFHIKIQEYQYIKNHNIKKYVLLEEGLIHNLAGRVPIKNNMLQDDKNDIYELIQIMPLPEILILIDTDIDTIMDRLSSRKKVLPMHRDKSLQVIKDLTLKVKERMAFASKLLVEKGVPVLIIDSKENVDDNTRKINAFISR